MIKYSLANRKINAHHLRTTTHAVIMKKLSPSISGSKAQRSRLVKAAPKPAAPAMNVAKDPRSLCPINLTLEAIGDSWSMLIIRDLMLRGHNSYQGFLRSGEKIATNILADRLAKLEQHGLISKSADPGDKRRFIYALTARGADLAPVLVELALFSVRNEPRTDMAKEIVLEMQKNRIGFAQRLTRSAAPRVTKIKPAPAPVPADFKPEFSEETLSLF